MCTEPGGRNCVGAVCLLISTALLNRFALHATAEPPYPMRMNFDELCESWSRVHKISARKTHFSPVESWIRICRYSRILEQSYCETVVSQRSYVEIQTHIQARLRKDRKISRQEFFTASGKRQAGLFVMQTASTTKPDHAHCSSVKR